MPQEEKHELILTEENYHSVEARKAYLGFSQFKDFEECEVMAMAKINGEYDPPSTEALLFGSWVDAHFSGTETKFIEENKDKLYSPKTGKLYAAFVGVEKVINFIENYTNEDGEKILLKYWSGEHQVIMTGVIAGVPVKIKIDSYFIGRAIVDGKCMKDLNKVWVDKKDGGRALLDYISAYDYPMEGALYQEVEHQNALKNDSSAKKLPFILNVATKEEVPNADLVLIDQDILDQRLEYFKEKAPRYQRIKMGLEKPIGCGKCPVCVSKKQIFAPKSYRQLYLDEEEE